MSEPKRYIKLATKAHEHDCDDCKYIATVQMQNCIDYSSDTKFDLYICEKQPRDHSDIIARFGVDGEYMSFPIYLVESSEKYSPMSVAMELYKDSLIK